MAFLLDAPNTAPQSLEVAQADLIPHQCWLERALKLSSLKLKNFLGNGFTIPYYVYNDASSYHIGESQIASLRHFLRFIELEDVFENFGFQKKVWSWCMLGDCLQT